MVFGEGLNRLVGELLLVKIGEKSFTYYFLRLLIAGLLGPDSGWK